MGLFIKEIKYESIILTNKEYNEFYNADLNMNKIKAILHNKVLHKLSSMVGLRLRNEKKYAKVVSVQLRNNDFFNYQHQKKLVNPISSNEDIYEVSCELLKIMWKEDPIRLVGLRVSDFTDEPYEQISLFDEVGKIEKRDKIQKTIDDINKKFGNDVIKSAALMNDEDL